MTEENYYNELCAYTLSLRDSRFIHQYVVDAYAAQHANEQTKPISITFALIGLYLLIEKKFSGKEIQRVHMKLGKQKQAWPVFALRQNRRSITAIDVMLHPAGPERDHAIEDWRASVWHANSENREQIARLLREHKII